VFSVATKLGKVVEFMLLFPSSGIQGEVELVRDSRAERIVRHEFVPCMGGGSCLVDQVLYPFL
jgi:hypothetical protein